MFQVIIFTLSLLSIGQSGFLHEPSIKIVPVAGAESINSPATVAITPLSPVSYLGANVASSYSRFRLGKAALSPAPSRPVVYVSPVPAVQTGTFFNYQAPALVQPQPSLALAPTTFAYQYRPLTYTRPSVYYQQPISVSSDEQLPESSTTGLPQNNEVNGNEEPYPKPEDRKTLPPNRKPQRPEILQQNDDEDASQGQEEPIDNGFGQRIPKSSTQTKENDNAGNGYGQRVNQQSQPAYGGQRNNQQEQSSYGQRVNQQLGYGQQQVPQQQPAYGQQQAPQQQLSYGQQQAPQQQPAYGQQQAPQQKPAYGQLQGPQQPPAYGQLQSPQQQAAYGQPQGPQQQRAYGQPQEPQQQSAYGQPQGPQQQPAYGQPQGPQQQPAYGQQQQQQSAYGQRQDPQQQSAYGPQQQSAYGQQQSTYGQPQSAYGHQQLPLRQHAYGQQVQQPAYGQQFQQTPYVAQPEQIYLPPIYGEQTQSTEQPTTAYYGYEVEPTIYGQRVTNGYGFSASANTQEPVTQNSQTSNGTEASVDDQTAQMEEDYNTTYDQNVTQSQNDTEDNPMTENNEESTMSPNQETDQGPTFNSGHDVSNQTPQNGQGLAPQNGQTPQKGQGQIPPQYGNHPIFHNGYAVPVPPKSIYRYDTRSRVLFPNQYGQRIHQKYLIVPATGIVYTKG